MNTRQFGKKIGKHAHEWGLNPSVAEDRVVMSRIISDIIDIPTVQAAKRR